MRGLSLPHLFFKPNTSTMEQDDHKRNSSGMSSEYIFKLSEYMCMLSDHISMLSWYIFLLVFCLCQMESNCSQFSRLEKFQSQSNGSINQYICISTLQNSKICQKCFDMVFANLFFSSEGSSFDDVPPTFLILTQHIEN